MEDQQKIDALTASIGEVAQNLNTAKETLQTELDSLKQEIDNGTSAPELDFSKLESAISGLGTSVAEVSELKPETVATETGNASSEQAPTTATGTAQTHTTDPQTAAEEARRNV